MSARLRGGIILTALSLGIAGAMGMRQNIVIPPTAEISSPNPNPKKKKRKISRVDRFVRRWIPRPTPFLIHPDESRRRDDGKPHQGARECARRRGDWAMVSMIDALKRYPYGINHRFPSINRPDRAEVDFTAAEPSRIQLLR